MSGKKKHSYLSPTFTTHSIITPRSFIALSFGEEDENNFFLDEEVIQDADEGEGGAAKPFWNWED